MTRIQALAACAAFATLAPLAHSAELITNGGFENTSFTGSFQTLSSGLTGWSIDAGSVDLINTYWQPAAGNYSIDLNGSSAAAISQAFATVVGQTYNVSFSMAGNTDGGGSIKSLAAGVVGINTYTFDSTGASHGAMNWESRGFSFVASSTLSTLTFAGDSGNGAYGAALDNVSVTAAVPEPETYAMLAAGLAMVGALARRRKVR